MRKRILKIVIWLAILGGVGYGGWTYYKKHQEQSKKPKRKLRTMTVEPGEFSLVISTTGVVEPKDVVEIRSKATGEVKIVHFEEGDRVEKDKPLISLDRTLEQRRVNQASADLAIAKANHIKAVRVLEHTQSKYRTELSLYRKRLVTKESLDNLKHDVAVKKAETAVTRAQINKAVEVLREARDRLAETTIVAPMTGIILNRYVQTGQIIFSGVNSPSGGTLLAKMANLDDLYVRVDVDEADVAHVRPKMEPEITVDALPGRRFRGTVIRINPDGKTENNVTVFQVMVKLPREASEVMKVRMTANVKIEVRKLDKVITVPAVAVRYRRGRPGVYVMEQGKPRFRRLKLGLSNGTNTLVRKGLKLGETVILSRLNGRQKGRRGFSGMFQRKKKTP